MSRFRDLVRILQGPLDLVRRSPTALERVRDLRELFVGTLREAHDLWIPAEARRRLADAGALLESDRPFEEVLPRIARRVAPLLEGGYPTQFLAQPTGAVPGVGPKIAVLLERKGIVTVEDLLWFLPRSYEDRRQLVSIEDLEVGHSACFEGTVTRASIVPLRNGRRFFQAVVTDGTAAVHLKWFRGFAFFQERIRPGARVLVAGDVRRYRFAKELHHPEVDVLDPDTDIHTLPRIVPIYAGVEGLPPRTLRRIVESAVRSCADLVDAFLPEGAANQHGFPPLGEAIREVHLPGTRLDPLELSRRKTPFHLRLVAEELFLLQAGLELRRAHLARRRTQPLDVDHRRVREARSALPFKLTGDQEQAWSEIRADLAEPHPMNRLLVGDVGTGKTVLAYLASVAADASGACAAVLAPTEILAEQHHRVLQDLATPIGIRVARVTGAVPAAERRKLERRIQIGEVSIVVGTHALLSDKLRIPKLRLVVIDEQHRFGVLQRKLLQGKGEDPHVLVMTATPIPRTLALTLFGDLDHSVLMERPPGRAPVTTSVVPSSARRSVLAEIRKTLARGEQVYVVYPLIEESEKQDLLDATRGYERLRKALPDTVIALLHGRLDARESARVMSGFVSGAVQLLVTTTVVEVGVDVPGATLLVVQHADRFGLAQLHQLRGRVGRGNRPGRAILIGEARTPEAAQRLAALEGSASGFDIAEEDLRIRGPGEWLGTRQAGHLPELRLADLIRHGELLPPIRESARALVAHDPELAHHALFREAVERRWGARLELGRIA
jgi:ATP-dependent DNA helicase RecG